MHIRTTVQLEVLVEKTFANFVVFGLVKDLGGGGRHHFLGMKMKSIKGFSTKFLFSQFFPLKISHFTVCITKLLEGKSEN